MVRQQPLILAGRDEDGEQLILCIQTCFQDWTIPFYLVECKFRGEDMIAKQISKAHKKSFFKGYQMQTRAKFHLFYKLRYVMNCCFTSEETPCTSTTMFIVCI